MRSILFLCLLMACNALFAQRSTQGRLEKTYEKFKTAGNEVLLRQTIPLSNGRAIAVGETETKTAGGKDAYFALFNPMGQEIAEMRLGGGKDDGFHSVAQLPDGTFLAAGYNNSRDKKQKAWLVHLSETGRILHERFDDGDAYFTVSVADDGAAYVLGSSQDQEPKIEIRCLKIWNWKVIFDEKYSFANTTENIKSAVCTPDGGVVAIGDTRKNGAIRSDDIWIMKLDKQGKMLFHRRLGEAKYIEQAEQIINTADKGFAVAGSTNNSNGESMNAWLLKLDELGNKQWEKSYGGRDLDFGKSVVQTTDDRYYLVGKTKSHHPEARYFQAYFVKIDASGNRLWEDHDGDKKDDWAESVTPLYDGSFLMTATTDEYKPAHSWVYRFRAMDDDLSSYAADNSFRRSEWQVMTDSRFLEPNQTTALSVRFTNNNARLVKNVQLKCTSPNPAIVPQMVTFLGTFRPNESKIIAIPLKTSVGLIDGQETLDMEVVVGTASIEKFNYRVTTKRRTSQQIFINTPPQYASEKDVTTVKLTVENPTAQAAQGLNMKIELPRGLTMVGNSEWALTQPLAAGKNMEVAFKYRGEILTELGAVKPQIACSLFQNGVLTDAVKVDIAPLSKNNTSNGLANALLMWMSPDEDSYDIQNINVSKPKFDIKLKAIINEPVRREQFKVFVDESALDGSKMDVVELSAPTQQQYRPIFSTSIELQPNKRYQIRVDLQTSKGDVVSSRTLIVKYNPEQPNLHVVSIGATHNDLKYTAKDAANMANFFRKQSQLPFKKVNVLERSDSARTDYKNIKRTFNDLVKRYENPDAEQRIEDKDYLIVFISSHGKTGDDKQYKLLPSDYNPSDGDLLTIDYQSDVMNQLNKINCHKIVMIDACHSGLMTGAKNTRQAEALFKVSQAAVGTTVIASCRADELSYEDEAWQNGAFTKALLEAFNNQAVSDEGGNFSSDGDGNKLVTLGEVMQYIKRRVPKLAGAQKRLTSQNPVVIQDTLDKEIPLFMVIK